MSKNEKNYILQNYISNRQAKLQFFCSQSKGINIFDKFCYSTEFNRPDMYYINNKLCYMFEHFEIDASLYAKRKGSSYKRNNAIANKKLKKQTNDLIKNPQIDKNQISSQEITSVTTKQEASKTNLKENFIRVFDNHYSNINEYKENLSKHLSLKTHKFKTIFIIEQTTEFGAILFKDGKQVNLELFYCDFVLEKLKSATNVDYFIFINKSDNERFFTIIEKGNFTRLEKHTLNYVKEKIFFIDNVTTFTTAIFIPKSELKNPKSHT